MTRKILIPIVIILVGVALAATIVRLKPEPPRATPPEVIPLVRVIEAQPTSHAYAVTAQGTVQPRTTSSLVAEVAGRVLSVDEDFNEGGFFEVGQVLLVLDDRDYRAAVAAADAEVATARLSVAREEEESRVAREEWERFGREGEPSSLVLREPQLAQARALLSSAEARLDKARRDLDRTRIRAPFRGRVRVKMADVGDYVAPGTPTASIYAVDYAEVRLPMKDNDLAFLDLPLDLRTDAGESRRGPAVTLHGEFAGSSHTWTGYVHRTAGEIDARTRMLDVVVRVADPYGQGAAPDGTPLSVGMFVEATIAGRALDDAYLVPREALINESQVAVANDDDRLELRDVEVLRTSRDQAILGYGLTAGDRVIVSRLDFIVDGMKIRTAEAGE
jgi:RND family efflux transporter MFP subunit